MKSRYKSRYYWQGLLETTGIGITLVYALYWLSNYVEIDTVIVLAFAVGIAFDMYVRNRAQSYAKKWEDKKHGHTPN